MKKQNALLFFIILLFSNQLFSSFITTIANSEEILNLVQKIIQFIAIIVALLYANKNEKTIKYVFALIGIYTLSLVFESIASYGSYYVFPHVFSKVLVVYITLAIYSLYKNNNLEKFDLNYIGNMIIIAYLFNLFVLGWIKYFSPFNIVSVPSLYGTAGDSRVFHATLIYLMLIPLIYNFNKYIIDGGRKNLFKFLFVLTIVVIQNHRSVWTSAFVALLFDYLFIVKNYAIKKKIKLFPAFNLFAFIGVCLYVFVFYSKGLNLNIIQRLDDIIYFQEQGTGLWRLTQATYYIPIVIKNLLLGLRFDGFKIPSLASTNSIFSFDTGHHFHNGYLDILFYHGLIGFTLTYGLIIYGFYKTKSNAKANINLLTLRMFLLSAFIFSFSYVLPVELWGFLGMAFAINYKLNMSKNDEAKTVCQSIN